LITGSGALGRVATARRSRLAVAALVAGLLLGGWVPPVRASQAGGLTLTVAQRWNQVPGPGMWSPYAVTVRNDGASGFEGQVVLSADLPRNTPYPPDAFPPYHSAVSVPRGSQRTTVIAVTEAPGRYHAELRDLEDRVVASADPPGAVRAGAAVAVLSDLPGAEQRIAAPLRTLTRVDVALSRFASARDFPAHAVDLSGLNGVVLDQFGTGALDAAQVRALEDFVGLGGVLVEAGGASWRRTLLPLPSELVPMRPTDTSTAPVTALAELGMIRTDAGAQVATGDVASWGQAAVRAADGQPLIVEGAYGAGRVVELTFDPFAAPFDTRVDLAALGWSQAIGRGLSGVQGGGSQAGFKPGLPPAGPQAVALTGSGPGSWGAGSVYLYQVLGDMPAPALPPFGLLVGLLIAYVLLVSFASYVLLRTLGRSGLLWATVPILAVVFTAGAYVIGFGPRGSDYQLTEVQVQRLGPGGVVEASSFDGVIAPRRGDIGVSAPAGTLVSTAAAVYGPSSPGGRGTVVTVGPRPEVRFSNVAVWDLRALQTLNVDHPFGAAAAATMPVEAHLRLSRGRVQGQVVNHTNRTVRDLLVASPYGNQAPLAATLAPGATAAVDVALPQAAPGFTGKGALPAGVAGGPVAVGPGFVPSQSGRQALVAMAASQAASRPGELVLVGFTDPVDRLRVEGRRAGGPARAVVVEPVRPEAADTLAAAPPVARLVSSLSATEPGPVDVYEFDLPQGLTGRVGLGAAPPQALASAPSSVEVYDWTRRTWRPVSGLSALGRAGTTAPLAPGETGQGVVRVRVRDGVAGQVPVSLSDVP